MAPLRPPFQSRARRRGTGARTQPARRPSGHRGQARGGGAGAARGEAAAGTSPIPWAAQAGRACRRPWQRNAGSDGPSPGPAHAPLRLPRPRPSPQVSSPSQPLSRAPGTAPESRALLPSAPGPARSPGAFALAAGRSGVQEHLSGVIGGQAYICEARAWPGLAGGDEWLSATGRSPGLELSCDAEYLMSLFKASCVPVTRASAPDSAPGSRASPCSGDAVWHWSRSFRLCVCPSPKVSHLCPKFMPRQKLAGSSDL